MTKISELIHDYTEYLKYERAVAKETVRGYISDIHRLINAVGDTDIESVTLDDLRKHTRDMSKEGLASATIRRRIHSLNTFYNWLVLEDIVEEAISNRLHLPKRERKQPTWLSDNEIRRFANTPSPHSLSWKILAWFGLRRSELLNLDWRDVRLPDRVIIIRDTKSKKDRVMPIPDAFHGELTQAWIDAGMPDEGYVTIVRKGALLRAFKRHLKVCGLDNKKVTPHTLRHSFASQLVRQGVSITVVKELLGHTDIATTMIYVHHSDELIQDAMDKHILAG